LTIPLIALALRGRRRRRVRQVMRGYRVLRASGRMNALSAVMASLTTTALGATIARPSRHVFGAAVGQAEIVTRQYLLIRVMGSVGLNSSLLKSIGEGGTPVVHPLPREWRAVIRSHGFPVAGARSALAWWGYVFLLWGYGAATIGRLAWQSLREARRAEPQRPGRYAFFVGLSPGNLPAPAADGRSYDIVTWYGGWPGRASGLETLAHGVGQAPPSRAGGLPVVPMSSAIPPLRPGALAGFLGWGICATALSLLDMMRGRWWHALLLSEAAPAALARRQQAGPLAVDYLFHASNVIYRPLWTYEAERQGSAITLYFYSTNSEAFKLADGYTTPLHSWQVMTWPRFLVWNESQAAFVRRVINSPADVRVVGPIWFHNSAKEMPDVPAQAVAVFDVQPQRSSRRQTLGTPHEFYTERVAVRFVLDILEIAEAHGRAVAFKRKRHIGPMLHKGYARAVERLSASPSFISVDPDISAARVVDRCAATISMPFTSTALLACHAGKPSIYYDPVGFIQKDDRASHGIPIVSGRAELDAWFAGVKNS
jgi:polysaccharide biosynthesis PFTS motif protein